MDTSRVTFDYGTYNGYIRSQRARALRTRRQTLRYAWHRQQIASNLGEICPTARTMLCVGARNDAEVLDFEKYGFETQGIDLFSSERIIKCDMSKIDRHASFTGKTFDIFVAIHSIEHCLDFQGFLRCLEMCNQALACVTPQITAPTEWDCSAFGFAHPGAGADEIENAFPAFQLCWRAVVNKTLMFIVRRRS